MAAVAVKPEAVEKQKHCDRHVMVVCTGEACCRSGAKQLVAELHDQRKHTDGDMRIGTAKCIGHCQAAPAMMEDGKLMRWMSLRRLRFELARLGLLRNK